MYILLLIMSYQNNVQFLGEFYSLQTCREAAQILRFETPQFRSICVRK